MSKSTTGKKKIVRKEADPKTKAAQAKDPGWKPEPEAKSKANRLRIFAWIGWLIAIGVEIFAIFWILKQVPVNMTYLIIAIVVTGIFSIGGSLMWKQANRLDPASKKDTVRFWVQNQFGAIMAIISFLPLIILIFLNKDMDGKQKGIAGGIGIVVLIIATLVGVSYESPSQEQYAAEQNIIETLTGKDEVVWTKSGKVFHVCTDVPDVNKESQDGQIYVGTVADAHAAGKDRIVSYWDREAVNYCGYTQEDVDNTIATVESANGDTLINDKDEAPEDIGTPES